MPAVRRTSSRRVAVVVACVALPLAAGCGSSSTSTTSSSTANTTAAQTAAVKVSTAVVPGVGTVLVNAEGHTLYTFAPDDASKVTCVSTCALVWPPDKLAAGTKAIASGQVKSSLLSSIPDPEGGDVVTYAGWPLYRYVADTAAGTAQGQAMTLNGGAWYVITAAGKPVH